MRIEFRLIAAAVIAVVLDSATLSEGARFGPLDEDAASNLLMGTLKQSRVYAKRISLGCIACGTEETTDAYFQFYIREVHSAECGGAPEVSPVVDRYRVYRRSGRIERWQPTDDTWHRYDPAKIR
jgi:hypothetical protein